MVWHLHKIRLPELCLHLIEWGKCTIAMIVSISLWVGHQWANQSIHLQWLYYTLRLSSPHHIPPCSRTYPLWLPTAISFRTQQVSACNWPIQSNAACPVNRSREYAASQCYVRAQRTWTIVVQHCMSNSRRCACPIERQELFSVVKNNNNKKNHISTDLWRSALQILTPHQSRNDGIFSEV